MATIGLDLCLAGMVSKTSEMQADMTDIIGAS